MNPRRAVPVPHPLEPIVFQALRQEPAIDTTHLFQHLSGCARFWGEEAEAANEAYRIVARDVLGYMESQGKLRRDPHGWYWLAVPNDR